MTSTSPPPEAQRFGRSQTPESPRPVHVPEPANIPVLLNQMDPVFNDTATYNIPNNQPFSPFPDPASEQGAQNSGVDEHDAVQNFFREAEHQAAAEPEPSVNIAQDAPHVTSKNPTEANSFPSIPPSDDLSGQIEQEPNSATAQTTANDHAEAGSTEKTASDEAKTNTDIPQFEGSTSMEGVTSQSQQSFQQGNSVTNNVTEGVDYQSLLDTIAQNTSNAPAANATSAPAATAPQAEESTRSLPSIPGLPPKPPPQAHPIDFPSYSLYDSTSTKTRDSSTNATNAVGAVIQNGTEGQQGAAIDQQTQQSAIQQLYPQLAAFGAYGQVPPPKAGQLPMIPNQAAPGQDVNRSQDPLERPWTPKTQSRYDQFLEAERRYVTEGIWDKFPVGSRLFVGNLPSEKVTKRDLFHKFHKHGDLAQISIKQAYGFVQFLEAASCLAALNAEQGVEIRGRKVHLEVSKPQKNTRNAGSSGGGSGNKNQQRRRSRSPERAGRRENRNFSDFRDEPGRRRDDHRNRRSPSPRGYRQRDDYRSAGRDGRSRSPIYANNFGSPPVLSMDDEAALQLPRRDPRHIPDVQLLVLEPEVVQSFINWVEQGFRSKGLQASTIWVNNRLPLPAVIKRQIIEGVQAVVKLTRAAQTNSKIPLQVFDRSAGASNVNFSEYVDLDISVAADVVLQARQRERSNLPGQNIRPQAFPPQHYQPQGQFAAPQSLMPYPQQTPTQFAPQPHPQQPQYTFANPQQAGYRPSSQPHTPTTQPPNLQQLLANLRQPPSQSSQPFSPTSQNAPNANVAGYFGGVAAPQQYGQVQQAPYGQYSTGAQGGQQQPNVQNIMEQLARYQR